MDLLLCLGHYTLQLGRLFLLLPVVMIKSTFVWIYAIPVTVLFVGVSVLSKMLLHIPRHAEPVPLRLDLHLLELPLMLHLPHLRL